MENVPQGFCRCLLGDAITLKRGYDLSHDNRLPGDVPVVSSSGITGTHNEAKVEGPGVVTGRYGTLGEVFYVEQDFWPLNTALYVCEFKGNDPKYISYLLRTLQLGVQNAAGAVPGVNRNTLHQIPILLANLDTQRRIADILSAYDDLIANNNRRMALLEESMHLLYREWFVHHHFPGHEHTPIVDGVPAGWEKIPLGDTLTLQRGFDLPHEQRNEGSIPVYASTGIAGTHNVAKVAGPGIVTGRSGTLGVVMYVSGDYWPLNTALWVTEFKRVNVPYAYFLLASIDLPRFGGGAAVPTLNRNSVHAYIIVIPPEALQAKFAEIVQPCFDQIDTLREYNHQLRTARDLLLPRLMNGAIPL